MDRMDIGSHEVVRCPVIDQPRYGVQVTTPVASKRRPRLVNAIELMRSARKISVNFEEVPMLQRAVEESTRVSAEVEAAIGAVRQVYQSDAGVLPSEGAAARKLHQVEEAILSGAPYVHCRCTRAEM